MAHSDELATLRERLIHDERNEGSDYARGVDAVLVLLEQTPATSWKGGSLYRIKEQP